jgi:antitoxin component YwqK of YwqJK toxin-antitoxin module
MKHLLLVVTFFLSVFLLNAQELTDSHINKADAQGRKQGLWRIYDDGGNLKYTGEYVDGNPVDTFTYYYPTGKPKAVLIYSDSGKVAYAKNYFPGGRLMAKGKYMNQKKDSTWIYFSEHDGSLSAEENYKNGMKEGVFRTYYPEGNVAEEITYLQDVKDGAWTQYFTDGKVKLKANYIRNKLEGQYTVYHFNGMIEISGTFKNSEKNGTWVYMKETGEMEKREDYTEGRLVKQTPAGKPD